jgi:hypothetical protein
MENVTTVGSTAKVVSRGLDTDCAAGYCLGSCSHLMWVCAVCSSEGGWGSDRELLQTMAADHSCATPPATASASTPNSLTVEELITEARNYAGDNSTARWPSLIVELGAALETATSNSDLAVEADLPKLDPEPYCVDEDESRRTVEDITASSKYGNGHGGTLYNLAYFAPRPEYSQNRADYETGNNR